MAEPEVLVVGAGIGGLSAALALAARGVPVRILEAAARPGGKAGTVCLDGMHTLIADGTCTRCEYRAEVA